MTRRSLTVLILTWLLAVGSVLACTEPGRAQARQGPIVALGASNTAGMGVSPDEAYPAQLADMLRTHGRPVQVLNAGVSGDTTAGMLARLDADVPDGTRLVLLQLGSNDGRSGLDRGSTLVNFQQMTQRMRVRHIQVIRVDQIFGAIPANLHQTDGVHLTPEGYRVVATRLLPVVLRALQ